MAAGETLVSDQMHVQATTSPSRPHANDAEFYIRRMREVLGAADHRSRASRAMCGSCQFRLGIIERIGSRNAIRCAGCRNLRSSEGTASAAVPSARVPTRLLASNDAALR